MADFMKNVHAQVKSKIEESNAKYKLAADVHSKKLLFKEGSLVWVVLSKERQLAGSYMNLNDRKVGPCKVLSKINDNAYQVQVPPPIQHF